MTTSRGIKEAVEMALPKGKPYAIRWDSVASSKSHILRILTPAWKTQPRWKRIAKVQHALNQRLAPKDLRQIFRVSVLTQEEFQKLKPFLVATGKSSNGSRHR